ncbi:MAG: DegT/DnrJ/EryC1/StrS family aminotransferase [Planctomycetota bacterium]
MTDAIPLSMPDITDAEVRAVVETLRSGRLSIGPRLETFERAVARRCRRTHGVGVSSGTAALHLALMALGVGPGDEVIVPTFTFVAPVNAITYVGARPVFVDCDPRSLNADLGAVERAITDRTRAIIGVEVFGNPAGMAELAALCNRYELPLIEDACEGLGGSHGPEVVGGFGRVAVFGFYPNKQITTGEGGMLVTDDDRLADLCRSLRNQGRPIVPSGGAAGASAAPQPGLGSWLQHERIGWNFRLDEMSAALGAAQMSRLDEIIEGRQRVAELYTNRLLGNSDLITPTIEPDTTMSWFVYVVRLSDRFTADDRNMIIDGLRRHDIGAADYFPPVHLMPPYRELLGHRPGDFPAAESVAERTLALPFHTQLTERDIDLVCQTLSLMITRVTFARD